MKGSGYRGLSRTVLGRQTTEPTNGAAAGLSGYGDLFLVRDMRKKSRKEPQETKSFAKSYKVVELQAKAPQNFSDDLNQELYGKYLLDVKEFTDKEIIADLVYSNGYYQHRFRDMVLDSSQIFNYPKSKGSLYADINKRYVINKCLDYLKENKQLNEYKDFVKILKKDLASLDFIESGELGKPTIKFEFESNDELKKFLQENKENLIDSEVIDAEIVDDQPDYNRRQLNGYGETVNDRDPDRYNYKLSDLDCKGLTPTYKPLKDYGRLICKKSTKENIYLGDGFNVTESLLIQKVIENYKTVAPLAEHLKADTPRQSAFNVWYWLQENVRYNYDAPGKEEIRSPARTWADRQNGVDCDCLAVFTYCLLLSMGYNPKFEIVAFDGKPNCWAHIYVNLNGMAVDRVMRIFDERPALIAKTKMLEVPVYSLEGLSGLENELSGLESLVLQKINNGTATASDCCCWRKANALRRLSSNPVEQKTFAMFMPYIHDVDLDTGDVIFLRQYSAMAALMRWADEQLMQLAAKYGALPLVGSEEYNSELGSVWGTIKSWGKSIGNAIAAPVKAVYQITKSATKATVNAVKASANLIAAGAQAVTGHSDKAKELMQKVLSQTKAAVITPLKDAVDITKDQVKDTIIEPTKTSIELVKVVLVKLNPITVLMRNAWRALIAINFVGMASRIGVGMLSESEAAKYDVVGDEYATAQKAYNRSRKFFTAMGGDGSKFDSTVKKAMFRKPLFSGDYKLEQQITENDELAGLSAGLSAGLGEGVTIASCLAAVGAFFAKIWAWIKDILPKVVDWVKDHKEVIDIARSFFSKDSGGGSGNSSGDNGVDPIDGSSDGNSKQKKAITTALIAAGGVGIVYLATKGNGKSKKKRRGK